ncbi:MAG: hypothetical protein DRP74_08940 [Candidatus Omnitrophota bacterium]|nr:MAG: hypothetical protein DRP74_08940 [Candidatus Omnitrophota bacterium]
MGPLFMSRAKRDKAWRKAGKPGRRNSVRNQLLHPQYVEDYQGQAVDTGFGNTMYKTHFRVLYSWQ